MTLPDRLSSFRKVAVAYVQAFVHLILLYSIDSNKFSNYTLNYYICILHRHTTMCVSAHAECALCKIHAIEKLSGEKCASKYAFGCH